ncbi:MAG TPA: hypothetical protein PLN31_20510 [Azoarcus taiwanensis]|nr:hypothetical protein [Azoarcus taiwanensis]
MSLLPRAVFSNCTMRKAAGPSIGLNDVSHTDDLTATARRWHNLVTRTPPMCAAGELYKGRSIMDAMTAAIALEGRLFIVSAGLGLVATDDPVPNYDLTVAPGSELARLLARQGLQPQDWWAAITKERDSSLSALITGYAAYLALPASYLRLLRADLESIPAAAAEQLRIFTSEAGRTEVPERLSSCIIPYDDRLECVSGFNGTRADFPQRALRHFVERLRGHTLSQADGQDAVLTSLSSLQRRALPERVRASDDEIRALLREQWAACAGSSTRLLRYLRDDAKVSCEQGRFRALWRSLAAEIAG